MGDVGEILIHPQVRLEIHFNFFILTYYFIKKAITLWNVNIVVGNVKMKIP